MVSTTSNRRCPSCSAEMGENPRTDTFHCGECGYSELEEAEDIPEL